MFIDHGYDAASHPDDYYDVAVGDDGCEAETLHEDAGDGTETEII